MNLGQVAKLRQGLKNQMIEVYGLNIITLKIMLLGNRMSGGIMLPGVGIG
tara:strand:- start:1496 stop:1645 length:150 start_codon:yes stop_codon:yes gene_type:complete